eukprot:CAMPEP_0179062610 /NCGR_PEP_ID=MMETSP0796-20121207/27014_1 /TAXON_ID=73915 /ORGANISM="Pyrodinium bahamense, Strain pbaha01" /LENGTH=255 /DNA_ID=CAMNT_0020759517 /DNA_START=49 /DNA_END=813 /DNA_ORIENTATION=-
MAALWASEPAGLLAEGMPAMRGRMAPTIPPCRGHGGRRLALPLIAASAALGIAALWAGAAFAAGLPANTASAYLVRPQAPPLPRAAAVASSTRANFGNGTSGAAWQVVGSALLLAAIAAHKCRASQSCRAARRAASFHVVACRASMEMRTPTCLAQPPAAPPQGRAPASLRTGAPPPATPQRREAHAGAAAHVGVAQLAEPAFPVPRQLAVPASAVRAGAEDAAAFKEAAPAAPGRQPRAAPQLVGGARRAQRAR